MTGRREESHENDPVLECEMTMETGMKLIEVMAEDATVLEAHGRLDSTTAQQLRDRLIALVQAGRNAIVLDLTNIAYVCSAGFQALLIGNRVAAESGGNLALCELTGNVKRLFEIACLTEQFLICQTRADGIAKLREFRFFAFRRDSQRKGMQDTHTTA
jgi:anti-sigma B factor antagonist